MSKSERLKPVVKIALQREQRAALALAQAQRQMLERAARLNELRVYRSEYQSQFSASNQDARSALRFADFHAFLQRLDHLIQEQERLHHASKTDFEFKKKAWLILRGKTQALDKAIDRFKHDETLSDARRDQREADDRVPSPIAAEIEGDDD